LIGYDAFDRHCWSGISYFFFSELQRRGRLHRTVGVEVPTLQRYGLMARNYRRDRRTWRFQYYMDPCYRRALTHEVGRRITPEDMTHDFLQLGAMYNVADVVSGRTRCYSYHDGNLAEAVRSPYGPKDLDPRKVEAALAYEREVYQKIDCVFAMSEYLRQSFISDCGVRPERVFNIGAGINLETIPAPFPGKAYDSGDILFIGVDFARKGGYELLEAFRVVHARRPKTTLHLVGPSVLRIPDSQRAGVVHHGFLSKSHPADFAKLESLFRNACLFVMASRYEPFGIAPLEAMAYEVPALVTDRWALAEMVTPGETGDWVECENVDALTEKLDTLLSTPDVLARMGRLGRERVLSYFTWEKVVDRLLATLAAS
jgi:glycosyltransferase involved in cell wall biosynthesis